MVLSRLRILRTLNLAKICLIDQLRLSFHYCYHYLIYSLASISTILNSAYNIEDLPAPVRPTHPIFSPGFMEKDILFKIKDVSFLYRIETFVNVISPSDGQELK